ncbi:GFA family protein [Methylomarinum sp. Ch1-1]|uniref:GFA family protein n=1 Tax=Methylomarinum roseum TaxID=3067653 RepID=A0AAU7NQN8_9GAMM|nr:GFA family protein [Methylomarinum sp. Ch1-1]MDP4520764.1 GFA family protein [Methylomarinum sp. Ch1-1]
MSHVTLKGGCLCGAVKYEVNGDLQHFYHCYCSRCRKSSGTGHTSNVILSNANLLFTGGESSVKQYKVPEAKRFTRQFCSNCGSSVAQFVAEMNFVVIPAGSLEGDIPIKPQARIFWDSRVDWACDGDTLPRYSEYPG